MLTRYPYRSTCLLYDAGIYEIIRIEFRAEGYALSKKQCGQCKLSQFSARFAPLNPSRRIVILEGGVLILIPIAAYSPLTAHSVQPLFASIGKAAENRRTMPRKAMACIPLSRLLIRIISLHGKFFPKPRFRQAHEKAEGPPGIDLPDSPLRKHIRFIYMQPTRSLLFGGCAHRFYAACHNVHQFAQSLGLLLLGSADVNLIFSGLVGRTGVLPGRAHLAAHLGRDDPPLG